jgi:hypothetical protein
MPSRPQSDADDPAYSSSFCCTASCGRDTEGIDEPVGADDLLHALKAARKKTSSVARLFMASDCKPKPMSF